MVLSVKQPGMFNSFMEQTFTESLLCAKAPHNIVEFSSWRPHWMHTYRQSQYRVQERPVVPFNSCVALRIEVISPPTQVKYNLPSRSYLLSTYCLFTIRTSLSPQPLSIVFPLVIRQWGTETLKSLTQGDTARRWQSQDANQTGRFKATL